jgi:hypothetical protein
MLLYFEVFCDYFLHILTWLFLFYSASHCRRSVSIYAIRVDPLMYTFVAARLASDFEWVE